MDILIGRNDKNKLDKKVIYGSFEWFQSFWSNWLVLSSSLRRNSYQITIFWFFKSKRGCLLRDSYHEVNSFRLTNSFTKSFLWFKSSFIWNWSKNDFKKIPWYLWWNSNLELIKTYLSQLKRSVFKWIQQLLGSIKPRNENCLPPSSYAFLILSFERLLYN